MEIIKHGSHIYDVKFYQKCPKCGAEILYEVGDQISLPDDDGIFCPECVTFLAHDNSDRILTWLNKNEELDGTEGNIQYR